YSTRGMLTSPIVYTRTRGGPATCLILWPSTSLTVKAPSMTRSQREESTWTCGLSSITELSISSVTSVPGLCGRPSPAYCRCWRTHEG
ncbi:hypothetical protein FOZ62_015949, partial [Perkinsus olseni]